MIFTSLLITSTLAACSCPSAFSVQNKCYCGDEGQKLSKCVYAAQPNWPLGPNPPKKECPDVTKDIQGFQKCVQEQIAKPLPNKDEIPLKCIADLKLNPSPNGNSPVVVAGSSAPSTPSTPASSVPVAVPTASSSSAAAATSSASIIPATVISSVGGGVSTPTAAANSTIEVKNNASGLSFIGVTLFALSLAFPLM